MISYAQNYEDVLLNRVFAEHASGFYIDVGACHPVVNSVTKLFYDRGWHGINIEPLPSASALFAQDRERDINLGIGLSDCDGTSQFYECPRSNELSTFSREQADELRRQGLELIEHSVPITTLARVCEEHAGPTIDFLKVDVEKLEREVMAGGDWVRFRPRLLVIEATRPESNTPSYTDWEPLLLEADYLFAFFDGLNRYYVRAEDRHLIPLLAVPANYFDHFERYEHVRQVEDLRIALAASEGSQADTQVALNVAQSDLADAQAVLMGMRRIARDSQLETERLRAQLVDAEAQIRRSEARLAPFQELGPIAIGVARGLRRMSLTSPRIASIAKRLLRRVSPRVRELVADA
jgi:FkbM family methyltransferase